jgi:hypothetical protein
MVKFTPCNAGLRDVSETRAAVLIWHNGLLPSRKARAVKTHAGSGPDMIVTSGSLAQMNGDPGCDSPSLDTQFVQDASRLVGQFLDGALSAQETSLRLAELVDHLPA